MADGRAASVASDRPRHEADALRARRGGALGARDRARPLPRARHAVRARRRPCASPSGSSAALLRCWCSARPRSHPVTTRSGSPCSQSSQDSSRSASTTTASSERRLLQRRSPSLPSPSARRSSSTSSSARRRRTSVGGSGGDEPGRGTASGSAARHGRGAARGCRSACVITVTDVGPRDGLQNEPETLSPAVRAELVSRLAAARVPRDRGCLVRARRPCAADGWRGGSRGRRRRRARRARRAGAQRARLRALRPDGPRPGQLHARRDGGVQPPERQRVAGRSARAGPTILARAVGRRR